MTLFRRWRYATGPRQNTTRLRKLGPKLCDALMIVAVFPFVIVGVVMLFAAAWILEGALIAFTLAKYDVVDRLNHRFAKPHKKGTCHETS